MVGRGEQDSAFVDGVIAVAGDDAALFEAVHLRRDRRLVDALPRGELRYANRTTRDDHPEQRDVVGGQRLRGGAEQ